MILLPIRRAFTLVEMMLVIGIIVVLAGLTIGLSSSVVANSERRETENLLNQLEIAMSAWVASNGAPMSSGQYICEASGFGSDWGKLQQVYDVAVYQENCTDFESECCSSSHESLFRWNGSDTNICLFDDGLNVFDVKDIINYAAIEDASVSKQVFAHFMRNESSKNICNKIDPKFIGSSAYTTQMPGYPSIAEPFPSIDLVDPWGTPILVVMPGAVPSSLSHIFIADDYQGKLQRGNRIDSDGTVRTQYELALGSCIGGEPYFISAGPDGLFGSLVGNGDGTEEDIDVEYRNQAADNVYSKPILLDAVADDGSGGSL